MSYVVLCWAPVSQPVSQEYSLREVVDLLGDHPLLGVLAVLTTCVAFFTLECIRLTSVTRWSSYSLMVKRIAIIAAILSVVLMVSRFAAVEGL